MVTALGRMRRHLSRPGAWHVVSPGSIWAGGSGMMTGMAWHIDPDTLQLTGGRAEEWKP